MPHRIAMTCLATVFSSGLAALAGGLADPAYVREVEAWRAKHEADYTRNFVPLAGLFFLGPGETTVGSAASNAIRLPERAPASAGRFIVGKGQVRFVPAPGAGVTLKGQPVTAPIALTPSGGPAPAD
jgi:hypothetical protein